MTPELYLNQVNKLRIGKTLPEAKYLHKSALEHESLDLFSLVCAISRALKLEDQWNLIKLFRKEYKLSLLDYPFFYQDS